MRVFKLLNEQEFYELLISEVWIFFLFNVSVAGGESTASFLPATEIFCDVLIVSDIENVELRLCADQEDLSFPDRLGGFKPDLQESPLR